MKIVFKEKKLHNIATDWLGHSNNDDHSGEDVSDQNFESTFKLAGSEGLEIRVNGENR